MPVGYCLLLIIFRRNIDIKGAESIIQHYESVVSLFFGALRNAGYPTGLSNPGCVCYVNCIIQCLENIYPFCSKMYDFILYFIL